ncbi:MAG: HAMP domain-containing protein [Planctomycetes bacterium]|nr:HAMP domain-containing protein [Planctomycetota bacterium]
MDTVHERAPRWRFGFAHRVAVVFAVLALLLAWLGVSVSLRVAEMQNSVRRVLEEQREAAFSRDVLHALRMLETHLLVRVGDVIEPQERETLLEYVSSARRSVEELRRGPKGHDPSSEEHTEEEDKLYSSIEGELDELADAIRSGAKDLRENVAIVRHHANVLHEEVRDEALDSSNELQRDGLSLRNAVLWTTAVALAVLASVLWMVWRFVVGPVERLREGAARIAGGELTHRVAIDSGDEIGELGGEFNRMAADLHEMRSGLEARVEERTREFVQAARLAGLGTMAAGIAHEINNPLASIASCAEGLERKLERGTSTPEQQREYLQIIAKEAYRAHGITSRLLEFARSEGGPKVEFSVEEMMRELEVLLEHRLRARSITLARACDPGLPSMYGRASECKQVLLNLVHNAIDASPAGGTIRVACRRDDGVAVLEVEDQGPGIAPEHLERIFDPFFTTKDPGKGTGLGLAIVHRIVESHGGRVEVQNTSHGALFRVRVPLSTT